MLTKKNPIIGGLSFALAVFYTVPWLTLADQSQRIIQSDVPHYERRLAFLFITVFLTALLLLGFNLIWKKDLAKKLLLSPAKANFLNVVIVVVLALLTNILIAKYFPNEIKRPLFLHYFFRNTVIAILAMLVGRAFELIGTLENVKTIVVSLQKEKLETEIEILKAQMNPHFFFNSMSTLKVLIRENSQGAVEFVDRLSGTFRYFLEKKHEDSVILKEELVHVESYLYVLKKRFGDGLDFKISLSESEMNGRVLHFSLWSAVENALKHNRINSEKPLRIEIFRQGNAVRVRNSINKKFTDGDGIGLSNLRKRYKLRNAGDIGIQETNEYFEIAVPVI